MDKVCPRCEKKTKIKMMGDHHVCQECGEEWKVTFEGRVKRGGKSGDKA